MFHTIYCLSILAPPQTSLTFLLFFSRDSRLSFSLFCESPPPKLSVHRRTTTSLSPDPPTLALTHRQSGSAASSSSSSSFPFAPFSLDSLLSLLDSTLGRKGNRFGPYSTHSSSKSALRNIFFAWGTYLVLFFDRDSRRTSGTRQ